MEDRALRSVVRDADKSFPSGHRPGPSGTISGFQSLNLLHFPATGPRFPFCNALRHDIRRRITYPQLVQCYFNLKPEWDDQIFEVMLAQYCLSFRCCCGRYCSRTPDHRRHLSRRHCIFILHLKRDKRYVDRPARQAERGYSA